MRKLLTVLIAVPLVYGSFCLYRAWVQVKKLDLAIAGAPVLSGSVARVDVITSGRVPVDVQLEVIQGTRAETLAVQRVSTHRNPFWDSRNIASTLTVTFSKDALAELAPGAALLRATAKGRRLWMYEPSPVVRDLPVSVGSER